MLPEYTNYWEVSKSRVMTFHPFCRCFQQSWTWGMIRTIHIAFQSLARLVVLYMNTKTQCVQHRIFIDSSIRTAGTSINFAISYFRMISAIMFLVALQSQTCCTLLRRITQANFLVTIMEPVETWNATIRKHLQNTTYQKLKRRSSWCGANTTGSQIPKYVYIRLLSHR